jgi:hypothetical protein
VVVSTEFANWEFGHVGNYEVRPFGDFLASHNQRSTPMSSVLISW